MTDTSIYQRVTDAIVAALEAGVKAGDYSCPWSGSRVTHRPVNARTGKYYRGVNVLALWAASEATGYGTGLWATYKQWAEMGAQVRRGEKATAIVFWKQLEVSDRDEGADSDERGRTVMMARGYSVFNADQVDGFTPAAVPVLPECERDAAAEAWFAGIPATVTTSDRACYIPSRDVVQMPAFASFRDAPAYYGVLAHELTHWSGAKQRLARDLSGRFGSESYAMEELVAELGAAFTCAILGLEATPRQDHAAYVASWLRVLKNDNRAIFTAAAKAQAAIDFLDAQSAGAALAHAA